MPSDLLNNGGDGSSLGSPTGIDPASLGTSPSGGGGLSPTTGSIGAMPPLPTSLSNRRKDPAGGGVPPQLGSPSPMPPDLLDNGGGTGAPSASGVGAGGVGLPAGGIPTALDPTSLASSPPTSGTALPGGALPGSVDGLPPLGSTPGSSLPSSGVPEGAGAGMPFMPIAPGAGGMPKDEGGSDASGLLSGGIAPWSGAGAEPPALGDISPVPGTATGGPGLVTPLPDGALPGSVDGLPPLGSMPSAGVPSSGLPEGAGAGMPFMPMAPGAGGMPKDEGGSDASGLLSGGIAPWSGNGAEPPALG
ncbi:hypothetical protein ACWC09_52670, partial [Streptomyces sp. NPDC001617]